jgi:hypothetical protein
MTDTRLLESSAKQFSSICQWSMEEGATYLLSRTSFIDGQVWIIVENMGRRGGTVIIDRGNTGGQADKVKWCYPNKRRA